MKFVMSIRVKLRLWYLVLITLLLVFLGTFAYLLLLQGLNQKITYPSSVQLAQIEKTTNGIFTISSITDINPQSWVSQADGLVGVSNYSGDQLSESEIVTVNTQQGEISIDMNPVNLTEMTSNREIWLCIYTSQDNPDVQQLLIITQETSGTESSLALFRRVLLITIPCTLFISGAISLFLVTKALRPVQAINKVAQEIQEKNLSKRIKVKTNDEIGKLAQTLNHMFERLEEAFIREKQFTSDASHELRAPLATIQGESTLVLKKERKRDEYQKSLEIIARESERMALILKRLMFLARDDSEIQLVFENVNLGELINELASDTEVLATQKNIKLKLVLKENLDIKGDKITLRELFFNLLDNAIRYTPSGGTITISLNHIDRYASISIKDSGIGIPIEEQPHLFKRFYRVDKSRSRSDGGAGLGLSISQRIAEIHNGRIEIESKIGEGSTFRVLLPLTNAN